MRFWLAIVIIVLPAMAEAADVSGIPKIREGDQVQIGNARIRLAGIDAPSSDQLCLNTKGERWTCGIAARDELIRHVGDTPWTCHVRQTDRRGRARAEGGEVRGRWRGYTEMAGEEGVGAVLRPLLA